MTPDAIPQGLIIPYLQTLQIMEDRIFSVPKHAKSWSKILLLGLYIAQRRTELYPVAQHTSRGTRIPPLPWWVGSIHFTNCSRHPNKCSRRVCPFGKQCPTTSGALTEV